MSLEQLLGGLGRQLGVRLRILAPVGFPGLEELATLLPPDILAQLGLGQEEGGCSVELPEPSTAEPNVPEIVAELAKVVRKLYSMGGAFALHADRINRLMGGAGQVDIEQLRASFNIKGLIAELTAASELIASESDRVPSGSKAVFNEVRQLVDECTHSWSAVADSKADDDHVNETYSVNLSGSRSDVAVLKGKIAALIEEENFQAVIAAGKKYGATFRLSSLGELVTILGKQVQINRFSYTPDVLTQKCAQAGVELKDLDPSEMPNRPTDEELLDMLPR